MIVAERDADARTSSFVDFVERNEQPLRVALTARRGSELGREATAECLAWAWSHWDRVSVMSNPQGYLYRVGCTRPRPHRADLWLPISEGIEPEQLDVDLVNALRRLSAKQRTSVVLISGLGWTLQGAAQQMNISISSVRNHHRRGMTKLRSIYSERGPV